MLINFNFFLTQIAQEKGNRYTFIVSFELVHGVQDLVVFLPLF